MKKQTQPQERGSDLFATAIKTMLDQRAADDPLFAEVYKKENKSIEGCCNYIITEVQHMKVNALTDEEVLGMAVHYYDEDKIIAVTAPACEVVVPNTPEIAEARKRELEAEAEKRFIDEVMSKMRVPAAKPKVKTSNAVEMQSLFKL